MLKDLYGNTVENLPKTRRKFFENAYQRLLMMSMFKWKITSIN